MGSFVVGSSEVGGTDALQVQDVVLDLGPAVSGSVAGGVTFGLAGAAPEPAFSVGIYERDDPSVLVAALADFIAPEWRHTDNDAGTGAVTLRNDDPALALFEEGDVIRFGIEGHARFAALIETQRRKSTDEAEDTGERTTLAGRGTKALFEEAVLWPEGGVDRSPFSDVRRFDYTSPRLDDSGWGFAALIKRQGVPADPYRSAPVEFPDYDAYWIGPPPLTTPQPVGDWYLRRGFTTLTEKPVRIFATADDGFELYLDGVPLMSELRAFLWGEVKAADVFLTIDSHWLAAKVTNIDRPSNPSTNITSFICTVMELAEGGRRLGDVLLHTDDDWACLPYPASAPGFTIGRLLRLLIEDAQLRALLQSVTLAFDDFVDSAGEPWAMYPDLAFPVGIDYLSLLNQLGETYCRTTMDVGSHTLRAYNLTDTVKPVTLTRAVNLTSMDHVTS